MVGALYLSLDHCHQEGLLDSKLNYRSVNLIELKTLQIQCSYF